MGFHIRDYRVIMERELGRELKSNEVVHHVNGNPSDNRIANLKVMTVSEHQHYHKQELRKRTKWGKPVEYICDNCGVNFIRLFRLRDEGHKHFCSAHCKCKYAGHFGGLRRWK